MTFTTMGVVYACVCVSDICSLEKNEAQKRYCQQVLSIDNSYKILLFCCHNENNFRLLERGNPGRSILQRLCIYLNYMGKLGGNHCPETLVRITSYMVFALIEKDTSILSPLFHTFMFRIGYKIACL